MRPATVPSRPSLTPNYLPQWFVTFILIAAGIGIYHWSTRHQLPSALPVRTIAGPGSEWFAMIRLPEALSTTERVEAYQKRFARQLELLLRQGFHPVLLSDLHRHWSRGVGLPTRPIVLVFEPGYERTYEVLGPVLREYRCPAVWMTDMKHIKRGDRRFINKHIARKMVESGYWDVGFYQPDGRLVLENRDEGKFTFGALGQAVWAPTDGRMAVNTTSAFRPFTRLNVNPTWTNEELLDRLLAELPASRTTYLTARQIGKHEWGTMLPLHRSAEAAFNVETPLDQRGLTLSWLGTRGRQDFSLELNVRRLTGELWVMLRSDNLEGNGVRVGFSRGLILAEEEREHQMKRVGTASIGADDAFFGGFKATIFLQGNRLQVSLNGRNVLAVTALKTSAGPNSMVRLSTYDKIRGAARAEAIRMIFTKL